MVMVHNQKPPEMQSNLERRRRARGLTRKQLGEKTGVKPRSIEKWEQYPLTINNAPAALVLRLAECLRCKSTREILELDPEKPYLQKTLSLDEDDL